MQYLKQHPTRFWGFLLAVVSLFPVYVALHYPIYLNDDTYITLTYAKNLAGGRGFIYNHPPPSLGTTTPLLALAVGGLGSLLPGVEVSVIAVFLTALCWVGVLWVFMVFHKEWGLPTWGAFIIGLVLIASGWVGFLGMEAYLFAFLLVLAFSLHLRGLHLAAGVITGLLFLTRGEGALVLIVISLLLGAGLWDTKSPWRAQLSSWAASVIKKGALYWAGFAIPTLAWFIYAQLTFGSFLPNTLSAKQAQGQTGLWRSFSLRLVNEWIPSWGKAFEIPALPIVNIWWVLLLVGVVYILFKRRQWLGMLLWITFYCVGYTLLDVSGYYWYQLPVLFIAQILFALGIVAAVEWLLGRAGYSPTSIAVSVLCVGLLLSVTIIPTLGSPASFKGDSRGPSYVQLSEWFQQNAAPGEAVAYIEIGYLGYFTDQPILDLAGLTVPDIVPHVAERDFAWGFWHYQPEFFIYLPDFEWALGEIYSDPVFAEQYRQVAVLPGPRETDFMIYQRIQE